MSGFKKTITFVEAAIVRDHNKVITENYKVGEVLETNPASARYWIGTGKAVPGKSKIATDAKVDEEPEAEKIMEKQGPTIAPKPKSAKKKTAPKK